MVPEHVVLSEKDANEFLEKFNVTKAQLPIILIEDPALKTFDVKEGDVVRVTRTSPVTGTSYAYRVVTLL